VNALELAEMLEHEPDISEGDQMSVALMLRKQDAAIRQLRARLKEIAQLALDGTQNEED
jgi:hypothetical protein